MVRNFIRRLSVLPIKELHQRLDERLVPIILPDAPDNLINLWPLILLTALALPVQTSVGTGPAVCSEFGFCLRAATLWVESPP